MLRAEHQEETPKRVYRLNEIMEEFIPLYSGTERRTLEFNIQSSYVFKVELENGANAWPVPHDVGESKFLGYLGKETKLKIMLEGVDSAYKQGRFVEHFATAEVKLGRQVITKSGFGSLADQQIEVALHIDERNLGIRLKNEGFLWNSYEAGKAYVVTMYVKRIRVIEVTPEMMNKHGNSA